MAGGPPSRVRSSVDDREELIDFFVALFEVEGLEAAIHEGEPSADFRADVARWLEEALRAT
jgi:hypothetical protein